MPFSCPHCGAVTGPADRFCGECGVTLGGGRDASAPAAGGGAPSQSPVDDAGPIESAHPHSDSDTARDEPPPPTAARPESAPAPTTTTAAATHAISREDGAGMGVGAARAPAREATGELASGQFANDGAAGTGEADEEKAATAATGEVGPGVAAGPGVGESGTTGGSGVGGSGTLGESGAVGESNTSGESGAFGAGSGAVASDAEAGGAAVSTPDRRGESSPRDTGAAGAKKAGDAAAERAGRGVPTGEFEAAGDPNYAVESRRIEASAPMPGSTVRGAGSTGRLRNVPKALEPATLLHSRYEIVRRIGGGGMGAVYLARDKNLGDAARAVKEMIQSNIDESQHAKAIGDFKRESMLLSSLEHASIPTIYDYFYDDDAGRFYLVMKYIAGGDFLARLRNAPSNRLDEKTVADWGCQVADVLHYLHRQNPPIIYRDLKPANLMIDGNSGRVMLIDFGIARWVQKEEKGVTAVGTMGYAPPELFSGKVEPRSDIYSLGATLFHLATGSDPQDNPLLIFDFNKNPRPRAIAPSLSNEMEAILMRAVEYKPEGRFRSAAELRDVLADHLEKLRTGQVTYGSVSGAGQSAGLKTMQVEMVYCGFCGGRIAGDDVYCAHCGQRQPMAVASAALRQARATAKLVVTGTTELDSSFHLQKESSLVGRSDPHSNIFPEVDLSPFDPQTKISRRHARIFRRGDVYLVEDLGSINGTIINDSVRLAPHQPRALESGDKLRLGETTLHFLIG